MCFENSNTSCSQDKNCSICYERSFASHERSKYWSEKNNLKPWQFKKGSNKKFWFKCNKSNHYFEMSIKNINNHWCPYPCCNKFGDKLCFKKECQICFNASFQSHSKLKFWSDKNETIPRLVCKNSHNKYWFKCDKSNHEFKSDLSNITKGQWCPYSCCCKGRNGKLCIDENCQICFNVSFSSSDKTQFWSIKNKLTPRKVFKNSSEKYWFVCENNHEFNSTLSNINQRNGWCPYCTIWKNQNECIEYIEKLTNAKFEHVRPNFLQRLELDGYNKELNLAIEYNGIQHYEYHPFFHKGKEENFKKQQERDKLKQELCHKNGIYLIVVPYNIENKELFIREQYNKIVRV